MAAVSYRKVFYYALLNFLFFAFYWGTHMYLPYYYKQVGLSDSHIGFLISMVSLTTLILVFPIGVLSDRIDPKKLFLAGSIIGIAFAILLLYKGRVKVFEPYIFIFALAVAMVQISLSAHFLKQMEEISRGSQSAIYSIGGILGAGVAAQIAGMIVKNYGPERLFWSTLCFAILLFVCGFGLPKIKGIPFHISEYKEDLRHPLSWILIFIAFIVSSHSGFEHVGYTLIQTEVIGLTTEQAGRIFLYISFTMTIMSWVSGAIHDRAKKPVLWAGLALLLSGVFQSASGYGTGFYSYLGLRMVHVIGDSFSGVLILVIASVAFTKKRSGGSWAILLLVRNLSDVIFSNVAGHLNQTIGLRQGFLVSGILVVIAGLLVIFVLRPLFWKQIEKPELTGALKQAESQMDIDV